MKVIVSFFMLFSLTFLGFEASAQASKPRKNAPYTMRDGVALKFGKLVEIKNGRERPLTQTYTANNGTKVTTKGLIIFPDGRQDKLTEGYAVNTEGEKVIFADDMIAPTDIRKHQKKVTGKESTTFTIIEKTKTVINDSTGRKAVQDTIRTQTME